MTAVRSLTADRVRIPFRRPFATATPRAAMSFFMVFLSVGISYAEDESFGGPGSYARCLVLTGL